jgi:hypothetical protein
VLAEVGDGQTGRFVGKPFQDGHGVIYRCNRHSSVRCNLIAICNTVAVRSTDSGTSARARSPRLRAHQKVKQIQLLEIRTMG